MMSAMLYIEASHQVMKPGTQFVRELLMSTLSVLLTAGDVFIRAGKLDILTPNVYYLIRHENQSDNYHKHSTNK